MSMKLNTFIIETRHVIQNNAHLGNTPTTPHRDCNAARRRKSTSDAGRSDHPAVFQSISFRSDQIRSTKSNLSHLRLEISEAIQGPDKWAFRVL
jgi:hypothetical protein